MSEILNQGVIMKALDYCYGLAVDGGIPGTGTAEDMAQSYRSGNDSLLDKGRQLVNWQVAKAATSGFLTNLGGLITLPVAIPADFAAMSYIQIKMVAAIAALGGHDIHDDRCKTFVYVCLCGNTVAETIIKDVGIKVGTKLGVQAINRISGATLTRINQTVGFRLITKFGETGTVNLVKWVPLVAGCVCGSVNGVMTKGVGEAAIHVFIQKGR